jgi:hypothetical protein
MYRDVAPLFNNIVDLLSANPQISLYAISSTMRIERHKIEQAVRIHSGLCYRDLKNMLRLKQALALLHNEQLSLSIKQIAAKMDMTPNALSRFIKTMTGRSASEILSTNDRSFTTSDRSTNLLNIESAL